MKCYEKYVMGAGANSFKIATHILLHSKPSAELNDPGRPKLTDAEEALLRNAVVLDEVDRPILLAQQVVAGAISYDEYVAWGQKIGVFKLPKQADSGHMQDADGDLKIFDPGTVVAASQPSSTFDVGVAHIAPPGSLTAVQGFKNAGKGQAVFEVARAVIFDSKAFGVFPSNRPPAVVCLLDSETPEGLFEARIEQYGLGAARGTSFFPISKNQLLRAGEKNPALTDPKFRARLEAAIYKKKVDVLVLDNLTTLSTKGGIYQPSITSEILDLAATLTARGITVIVVHHSDEKKGEQRPDSAHMRGSSEFSIRAHTEIVVIGQKQIRESTYLGTEEVRAAAGMDGATIGLRFKVCKAACVLEGHTYWLHLPLNGNTWDLLAVTGRDDEPIDFTMPMPDHAQGQGEHVPWLEKDAIVSADNAPDLGGIVDGMAEVSLADSSEKGLSGDEIKVLEYVNIHKKIEVRDARTILGWGDTKIRKTLSGLVEKGKLRILESGQGLTTVYGLPG